MKRNIHLGLAAAMIVLAVYCAYLLYAEYAFNKRINDVAVLCAILSVFIARVFYKIAQGSGKTPPNSPTR
jgi:hypothetical protein